MAGSRSAPTLAGAALGAQAGNFSFSGQLVHHNDVVQVDFSLAAAADVLLWTDSWQSGLNFDPQITLFSSSSTLLTSNDDNSSIAAGQGSDDAGLALTLASGSQLAAGHYRLTLTASANDAVGPTLANGFLLGADAPVLVADWNQPGDDINKNDQKGGLWQLKLSGVDQAAAVPEPGRLLLMLAGLLGLAGAARRRA